MRRYWDESRPGRERGLALGGGAREHSQTLAEREAPLVLQERRRATVPEQRVDIRCGMSVDEAGERRALEAERARRSGLINDQHPPQSRIEFQRLPFCTTTRVSLFPCALNIMVCSPVAQSEKVGDRTLNRELPAFPMSQHYRPLWPHCDVGHRMTGI